MIRKIGILILTGIISMYTVIPTALADDNNEIDIVDEQGNIFEIIWDNIIKFLFTEKEKEPTEVTNIEVEEEHPSGKANHGAIVSIITKIINKLESVVGKTHGMIMRAVAKTNWGKQIKEKDSLDDDGGIEGEKLTDIPSKKSIEVLGTVFDRILMNFKKQKEVLEEVLKKFKDKVPEKAKLAIERAIENNKRKMQRMEEIKARVRVRVKNRNSNNE